MSDRAHRIVSAYVEDLHRLLDGFHELAKAISEREPTLVERTALGAMLHAFLQGVEQIFTRISADMDRMLPGGDQWHRHLLDAMSEAMPRRAAVISAALRRDLSEYLGFRHLFRNISPLDLDWARMSPLVARVKGTLALLDSELDTFFEYNA